MKTARIMFVPLMAFGLALFAFPFSATALTVSPIRIEHETDPGTVVTDKFTLYNDRNTTQTYYILFRNFEANGETGEPTFTDSKTGLASWTRAQESITLQPLERKDVPFQIVIPSDVEPGGYTAAVFGSLNAPGNLQSGDVAFQGDVGTLLLLRVRGEFKEGADILDFKTTNTEKLPKSLPIDFSFRFQNSGDSWVKPVGDITIKNLFGKTSKIVPANPHGNNVLSKSIRKFNASWLESGKSESQDPKIERPPQPPVGFWKNVQHEWKYFAFGRYTATLSLTYNNDTSTTAKAATSFWVMPWHLLSVIAAAIAVVVVVTALIVIAIVYVVLRKKKQ